MASPPPAGPVRLQRLPRIAWGIVLVLALLLSLLYSILQIAYVRPYLWPAGTGARLVPGGTLLTVFAWMAAPVAFPVIALAILYFPARSPLLARHPWLHAIPVVAAAPMIVPSLMTVLYLTGLDAAADMALWDATHPGVFYASFLAALGVNVLALIEGIYRYQFNADRSTLRAMPHVPRIVDDKYRLEQLLGRGGMGAVYRARDMRLDRTVAVKVVRAELLRDVDARSRFMREAQIVARLQHPSIVAVYDYGAFPDGGAYLVMELVRGDDLRRVLQREGRLEPQAAMRILTAVCEAIEAAHREGVLHRDLKPENILLPGGGIDAKVLDFGVGRVLDEELPRDGAAGTIVGTPAYMAPEEFQVSRVDTRTDIFSLGVIAYEMLSGELPFGRGSLGEVILAQARGAPPMRDTDVPPAAERAIRTALDTDPDRRPSSPEAFAHLLGSALGRG